MKHFLFSMLVILIISAMPRICLAQDNSANALKSNLKDTANATKSNLKDTTNAIKPTTNVNTDSAIAKKDTPVDTVTIKKTDSTSVVATPMNCYKQWLDAFGERGVKPMTDGMQEVVIAFKSKESCHCYLGKVEVVGGKIKAPLYVQTEGGDYKTFVAMGKKLDPEFMTVQGDGIWNITNGMSVLFQTVDQEYGRVFFYKSLNKNKQANKEAPSPSDLLNN